VHHRRRTNQTEGRFRATLAALLIGVSLTIVASIYGTSQLPPNPHASVAAPASGRPAAGAPFDPSPNLAVDQDGYVFVSPNPSTACPAQCAHLIYARADVTVVLPTGYQWSGQPQPNPRAVVPIDTLIIANPHGQTLHRHRGDRSVQLPAQQRLQKR
jgi:hypothetical protein